MYTWAGIMKGIGIYEKMLCLYPGLQENRRIFQEIWVYSKKMHASTASFGESEGRGKVFFCLYLFC